MKFERLRLLGFKSFCEPTELLIQPGLTGVVGPNGCGKSNLIEALRWVMGENSYKNMRASAMDDVIFSGGGSRTARNFAEVGLILDNSDRSAPAAFNDADTIEVTRRIEREQGSDYRINGKEVRARDVQLLFADAATGSRSPSLVRQGQIGEIISAKPQARRRILEDAAGIAGLHSRRHEAELRLNAASENLTRLEDVLKQVEGQSDSLRRQARQAERFRNLAAQIRQNEAMVALVSHQSATNQLQESAQKLELDLKSVQERTLEQAEAAKLQAVAAHELPPLRERAAEVASRLEAERAELLSANFTETTRETEARERLDEIEAKLAATEAFLNDAQEQLAGLNARRFSLDSALRDESQRVARFEAELTRLDTEFALIAGQGGGAAEVARLAELFAVASDQAKIAEESARITEEEQAIARETEASLRQPLEQAVLRAQRLETEITTLENLLHSGSGGLWAPIVESVSVTKGYETALGAALGDDLDASADDSAPAHWAITSSVGDPTLPSGVRPLSELVQAPPALMRRLMQIGIVLRSEGENLRKLLRPGQRLVSKEGDLWRWDGFTQASEAPSAAARRLVEKNRLNDLRQEAKIAREQADLLTQEQEIAQTAARLAAQADHQARENLRRIRIELEETRERYSTAERRQAQIGQRLSALEEAKAQTLSNRDEATQKRAELIASIDQLEEPASLIGHLEGLRAQAMVERAQASEARAALAALRHEVTARQARVAAIEREITSWVERRDRAQDRLGELEERLESSREEQSALSQAPDTFMQQHRALLNALEEAETARRQSTDARTAAENQLVEADRAARIALEAMSLAREEKARSEAQLEAARQRALDIAHAITQDLETTVEDLAELAGLKDGDILPDIATVEGRLEGLRADRERLGAVNLRAEEELNDIETQRDKMIAERDDLSEAIKKLRAAIASLNKEGRERLLLAFDKVNMHFKELFTLLFGGGSAELQLVESEDPLEAGLDILARPPGKKPQTMTLLSGGEQALTAMSLIFAVFLTNPSPICVLDEVDAPLDDSNVERFCDLLDEMRNKTDTRFVTITHNPITMARMDRLFGVTQAERGVSDLVSVDLAQAEKFALAS